jgi:hypothetical protein
MRDAKWLYHTGLPAKSGVGVGHDLKAHKTSVHPDSFCA